MDLNIQFKKTPSNTINFAIVPVWDDGKIAVSKQTFGSKTAKYISNCIKASRSFEGKPGQCLTSCFPDGEDFKDILLIGLGNRKDLDPLKVETLGGKSLIALSAAKIEQAVLLIPDSLKKGDIEPALFGAHFAAGFQLRSYRFSKYKGKKPGEGKNADTQFKKLEVVGENANDSSKIYKSIQSVINGVFTARDLVNEPPNELQPQAYADFVEKELKPLGVTLTVLDEKKMQKLGMGGILAVGMGSIAPPRMVIMEWKGNGAKKSKPLALVGKGVTFDTGGISLKPGAGMEEMKMDMAGSAAVVGTMKALALRKSKAHVVGVIGLAENMPSDRSYRPGDIITSYAGKTIEILNTDAEGRLVLADCLTYVQQKYSPECVIDLATLTGAMMVALGHEYCGSFVNNDELWQGLEKASAATGEKLWRMPLDKVWREEMESEVADLQNLAKSGRFAGACTAAGFLEHFIEDGCSWAHLDIAGAAWSKKDKPTVPKYGSGFGVRVLDQLVRDRYE